jgi:DNA-binding MarR family transcriptional regulator
LFADPAWDILLDLYAERHSPRACAVTNLCQAAHVPATTALRWIARLEAHGCITRSPDPTDGRRVYVHLTPETLARLDRLMDGFLHHRS